MLVNGAKAQTPVLARPVEPEPAFLADLATKPCDLAVGKLQVMPGEFGKQFGGGVLIEEFANLGQPCALRGVEFEIHSGAHLTLHQAAPGNATARFRPRFRTDVTLGVRHKKGARLKLSGPRLPGVKSDRGRNPGPGAPDQ